MSKIKFERINENEIAVIIDSNVPLEMIEELTKNLEAKGMVEDKLCSSVTHRFFYRETSDDIADKLIKSLKEMAKQDDAPYYSKEAKIKMANKNRINDRRQRAGLPALNEAQIAAAAVKKPAAAPAAPAAPAEPNTLPGVPNKIHNPALSGKVNYAKKNEDEDDVEKSGYGPKGGGQYTPADNMRRKAVNVEEQRPAVGPNVNVKRYTTAKFGNSTPQTDPKLKRRQPVKVYSAEERAELERKMGLKKGWGEHLPFPNAEEELYRLAQETAQSGENAMATQLANMMQNKAMLNPKPVQPSSEDMIMAGESMGLGVSEKVLKSEDQKWGNTLNNWLAEATKPISQRFNSEEEELAYWDSLKVADRDDGKSGY